MDRSIEDKNRLSEYVVTGATLHCTLGAAPSTLVMPVSHGVFLNGKPQCNVDDIKPINILSFGTCNISNPPPTCIPMVKKPWVNAFDTTLLIDDEKALTDSAHAFCALGGIISIETSGQ